MPDKPEEKLAAPPPKPAPATKPAEEKPAVRAKIVEETGRYICKHAITFTNEKGERAHAKAGDVVAIDADDVKHLKKTGAIVAETREDQG